MLVCGSLHVLTVLPRVSSSPTVNIPKKHTEDRHLTNDDIKEDGPQGPVGCPPLLALPRVAKLKTTFVRPSLTFAFTGTRPHPGSTVLCVAHYSAISGFHSLHFIGRSCCCERPVLQQWVYVVVAWKSCASLTDAGTVCDMSRARAGCTNRNSSVWAKQQLWLLHLHQLQLRRQVGDPT